MKLSALLAPLIAAKADHATIMDVVLAFEAQQIDALERRRANDRERQERRRHVKSRDVTVTVPSRAGVTRVEDNLLPKKISGQEENKNISPEADKSAPVAVIGLPTVSEGDFPVSQADIDGWAEAFPGVDVRQQLAAMRQWLLANRTRRKTKRGMRKFVVSWLDRRQNAAPPRQATAPPSNKRRNYVDVALDRMNGHGPEGIFGDSGDAQRISAGQQQPGRDDGHVRSGLARRFLTGNH